MKTFFKIICIAAIAYAIFLFAAEEGRYWTNFKLYRLLLTQQLDEIRADYAGQSCTQFSEKERAEGYFEAFVTGYCKPQAGNFEERTDFLCAVALNCSCPEGRKETADCSSSSLNWKGCNNFDETTIDYCHQTASELKPEAGHLAADWGCFPEHSTLTIDDREYTVTDKGGLIKGRRFDIWFEDCAEAEKATGIYKVKIPE